MRRSATLRNEIRKWKIDMLGEMERMNSGGIET